MDATIPLDRPRTMKDQVDDQLAENRFALSVIGLFGVVAGALAVVGLYGVLSYTVGRRVREIGIRVALGSQRGSIVRLVVASGLRWVGVGLVLGMVGALGLSGLLERLLYGVAPRDPVTFLAVSAGFLVVAALACYVPARRAAGADPVQALRAE